jgi:hypothetical protein
VPVGLRGAVAVQADATATGVSSTNHPAYQRWKPVQGACDAGADLREIKR